MRLLDVHVHLHGPININVTPSDEVPAWGMEILDALEELAAKLGRIERKEGTIMTSVADLQAKADSTLATVTATKDVADAVKLVVEHNNDVIATLKQQLADAIAAGVDPAAVQKLADTLDAIQAAETSNAETVAAAVVEGTPVEAS
jgi:predicted  nucleic acid-binding Zn-ribbon protein